METKDSNGCGRENLLRATGYWIAGTSRRMFARWCVMMKLNIAALWQRCGRATAKRSWKRCAPVPIAELVHWSLTRFLATSWATARGSTTGMLLRRGCAARLVAVLHQCAPAAGQLKRISKCESAVA